MDDFGVCKLTNIVVSRAKRDLDVTRSAPNVHFAASVEELSILRLRYPWCRFSDRISLSFSVIFRDFATLFGSKATPGTAKATAF